MLSDPEVTWGSIYLLNIPKDCKELSAMKPIFSATDQKDIGEHSLGDGCVGARESERDSVGFRSRSPQNSLGI